MTTSTIKASTLVSFIIGLIILISIVLFFSSCSSPSADKAATHVINLYDYTVTTESGLVLDYYCYAADEYDAQRIVDGKVSITGFKSGSMKVITTINKPFAAFR
jgi:hypothetical protein